MINIYRISSNKELFFYNSRCIDYTNKKRYNNNNNYNNKNNDTSSFESFLFFSSFFLSSTFLSSELEIYFHH